MTAERPSDDEPTTPEEQAEMDAFDKKKEETDRQFRDLEEAGWTRKGNDWTHPTDPELIIYRDPYTLEQHLSPKLCEELKAQLKPKP